MSLSRREFLAAGAVTAATALTSGLRLVELAQARAPEDAVGKLQRWGLLIDVAQCADGCNACVTACHEENGVTSHNRPTTDAQWIRKVTVKDRQTGYVQSLPLM
ncbi:MAG TPA: twin-arginine translocation signal domain-containing protein, partial [Burkholderiales bacterium]|nr:twin-arginine translocation signal domain-containing protein [Burkholderiales bacterium]